MRATQNPFTFLGEATVLRDGDFVARQAAQHNNVIYNKMTEAASAILRVAARNVRQNYTEQQMADLYRPIFSAVFRKFFKSDATVNQNAFDNTPVTLPFHRIRSSGSDVASSFSSLRKSTSEPNLSNIGTQTSFSGMYEGFDLSNAPDVFTENVGTQTSLPSLPVNTAHVGINTEQAPPGASAEALENTFRSIFSDFETKFREVTSKIVTEVKESKFSIANTEAHLTEVEQTNTDLLSKQIDNAVAAINDSTGHNSRVLLEAVNDVALDGSNVLSSVVEHGHVQTKEHISNTIESATESVKASFSENIDSAVEKLDVISNNNSIKLKLVLGAGALLIAGAILLKGRKKCCNCQNFSQKGLREEIGKAISDQNSGAVDQSERIKFLETQLAELNKRQINVYNFLRSCQANSIRIIFSCLVTGIIVFVIIYAVRRYKRYKLLKNLKTY